MITARLIRQVCAAVLLAALSLSATLSQASAGNTPLPTRPASWASAVQPSFNLYRMDDGLYRSALPDATDLPTLEQLQIKTVINFYQHSDSDWLNDPNIKQVQLPLRTDRINDADVLKVLRSIRLAQSNGPVLIHCKHGQNRTGLIAAIYRVVYQGWSKEQALAEMQQGGFGGEERMADAENYLTRLDINALQLALQDGSCSTSPWALCQWLGALTRH
ncbi:dual specificity protein phosphatase family protein [Pseudomonas sp. 5P_3.1_Bac2]|uniref:dual specificity protein phosphatase family protein n=1 Tax=Pseudomonas sp. 5P_3.1_Bac2 TaxID=2971617 RepID=UPI0021C6EA8D|nr:dual specificity protein phosphatase family protein [Pseudomonas sp. 5P_3.1_Bac2]MCU1717114.1 dual specificity protein phosphatase family protein [Pseudomonas sp. 5P_3.1_Bac2]